MKLQMSLSIVIEQNKAKYRATLPWAIFLTKKIYIHLFNVHTFFAWNFEQTFCLFFSSVQFKWKLFYKTYLLSKMVFILNSVNTSDCLSKLASYVSSMLSKIDIPQCQIPMSVLK